MRRRDREAVQRLADLANHLRCAHQDCVVCDYLDRVCHGESGVLNLRVAEVRLEHVAACNADAPNASSCR